MMFVFSIILVLALAALLPAVAFGVSDVSMPGATPGAGSNPPTDDPKSKEGSASGPDKTQMKQCFIMDHMHQISQQNGADYKNFIKMEGDSALMLNLLLSRKSAAAFLKLRPYQLAQLVPMIRLYKVFMEEDGRTVKNLVELKFQDRSEWVRDPAVANALKANSKSEMFNSIVGRGDGVGIESVSIETQGTNPAEGDLVAVDISIFFQNPALLINQNLPVENRYLDLIWHVKGQTKKKDAREEADELRRYSPEHTQLAVMYGWAEPPGGLVDLDGTLKPSEIQAIKKAIQKSATMIFLTLTTHDLEYNQDGTVRLKAKYQGAIQSVLNHPLCDVLRIDPKKEQKAMATAADLKAKAEGKAKDASEAKDNISDAKKQSKEASKNDKRWFGVFNDTEEEAAADANLDAAKSNQKKAAAASKDAQGALQKHEEEMHSERYNAILNKLHFEGKLKFIDLSAEQLQTWKEGNKNPVLMPKAFKELEKKDSAAASKYQAIPPTGTGQKYYKNVPSIIGNSSVKSSAGGATTENVGRKATNKAKPPKEREKDLDDNLFDTSADKAAGSDVTRIYFFYFGDLVESMANMLYNPESPFTRFETFHILLGQFKYYDYKAAARNGGKLVPKNIQLANVPISLEAFEKYFLDNVVRQSRNKLMFNAFLEEVCQKLLVDTIQGPGNCRGAGVPFMGYKVGITALTAPSNTSGKSKIACKALNGKGVLTQKHLMGDEAVGLEEFTAAKPAKKPKDFHFYYVLNIANEAPTLLEGNPREDIKYGIHHMRLGEDRGLVKNIKFNKTDIPALGPANMTADDRNQSQLRHKYNANVDMVGNAYFYPGAYVYIDPTMSGMGSPRQHGSISRLLGLGGYFKVNKVTTELGAAGFETNLECIWETFGNAGRGHPPQQLADSSDGANPKVDGSTGT